MPKPEDRIYDGLAMVAHAIRRSTALYIAMHTTTPEEGGLDAMEVNADRWAAWIRGGADDTRPKQAPLGQPFQPSGPEEYREPDPEPDLSP